MTNFICPICNSRERPSPCYKNNGVFGQGGEAWIEYYICQECSVMFLDPDKFTMRGQSSD
jgi:hypothetical protein